MEDCKACQVREEAIDELMRENDKLRVLLGLKKAANSMLEKRNKQLQQESDDAFRAMCQADGYIECTIPPEGWRCTRGAGHDGPCAAVPTGEHECHTTAEKVSDSQDGHISGLPCCTQPH